MKQIILCFLVLRDPVCALTLSPRADAVGRRDALASISGAAALPFLLHAPSKAIAAEPEPAKVLTEEEMAARVARKAEHVTNARTRVSVVDAHPVACAVRADARTMRERDGA